jgi:GH24 family phage-related lysozyme (muramidase)
LCGLFFRGNENMKLVENWRAILAGAWSVRLMILAAILSALPVFVGLVSADMLGIDPILFAVLASGVSALAVIARVMQQAAIAGAARRFVRDESGAVGKRVLGVSLAALVVGASAFVAPWEGLRTKAYQDVVGVWTVCYGETSGVVSGDIYSPDDCEAMLDDQLRDYAVNLGACLRAKVPAGAAIAFLSWSYNVGTGAACRSALVRKANSGDLYGACDELLRWNRAGGRVVRGLANRREAERALCTKSLVLAGIAPLSGK